MTEPADGSTPEPRSRYARPLPHPDAEPPAAPAPGGTLPPPADRQIVAGRRRSALVTAARIAGPPAALVVVATLVLIGTLVAFAGSRSAAVNAWLLTVGALALWALWRALAGALPHVAPSAFDSVRVRPVEPPSRLYGVIAIEAAILDAEWSRGGVEHQLRPLLRKIAAARLIERHQVDLETEPAAARQILGDELWALVGPEPPRAGEAGSSRAEAVSIELAQTEAFIAGSAATGSTTHAHLAELAGVAGTVRPQSDSAAGQTADWTRARRGRRGIPRATIGRAIDLLEAL